MWLMRHLFPSFDGPARVSPYFYVPPKRRWWPLLATFAAGGVCVLALLGSSPRTEEVNVVQKPIVHQVGPGSSTRASSLPKPTISRTATSERADAAGVVPPAAEDPVGAPSSIAATPQSAGTSATPAAAAAPDAPRSGTAIAGAQTATTSPPSNVEMDKAPAARAKPSARQSSARSSSSRHASRKSRRHEPSQDTFAGDYRDRNAGDWEYRDRDSSSRESWGRGYNDWQFRDRDQGDRRSRERAFGDRFQDRDYRNWGYRRRDDRARDYGDNAARSWRFGEYQGERFGSWGDRYGGNSGRWGGWFSGDNN